MWLLSPLALWTVRDPQVARGWAASCVPTAQCSGALSLAFRRPRGFLFSSDLAAAPHCPADRTAERQVLWSFSSLSRWGPPGRVWSPTNVNSRDAADVPAPTYLWRVQTRKLGSVHGRSCQEDWQQRWRLAPRRMRSLQEEEHGGAQGGAVCLPVPVSHSPKDGSYGNQLGSQDSIPGASADR